MAERSNPGSLKNGRLSSAPTAPAGLQVSKWMGESEKLAAFSEF